MTPALDNKNRDFGVKKLFFIFSHKKTTTVINRKST